MLHTMVEECAAVSGHQPAVIYDDGQNRKETISYKELSTRVIQLKEEFTHLGMKDAITGVLLKVGVDLPCVLLGLLCSKCPFYPISDSNVQYAFEVLTAVRVSYIVIDQEHFETAQPFLESLKWKEESSETLHSFGLLLFRQSNLSHSNTESADAPTNSNMAYCITTSGTTSMPKVVRVPHSCIVPNIKQFRKIFDLKPGDRVLLTAPLTFDPSMIDIFCTLSSGACLVVVPQNMKQVPEKLIEVIHVQQKVTVMQATPSLMRTIGHSRLRKTLLNPTSHLRVLALGGEQFPDASELQTWLHPDNKTAFFNLYGITEVSCWATCHMVDKQAYLDNDAHVPIGQALDETLIKIEPLPNIEETSTSSDHVGHILIGSSSRVCSIDNDLTNTTKENKSEIIWRNTGDLGKAESNGNIYYIGRLDTQVKRLGKRLNLSVVEKAMEQHSEITHCCALCHNNTLAVFFSISKNVVQTSDSEITGQNSAAALSPKNRDKSISFEPSSPATQKIRQSKLSYVKGHRFKLVWSVSDMDVMLRAHLQKILPYYAVPDVFIEIRGGLPVTPHGKLDKNILQSILEENLSRSIRDLSSCSLKDVWKTYLPTLSRDIQGSDNFLSLGGDSLSAVRLATALQSVSAMSLADIYDILVSKDFDTLSKSLGLENLKDPQTNSMIVPGIDKVSYLTLDRTKSPNTTSDRGENKNSMFETVEVSPETTNVYNSINNSRSSVKRKGYCVTQSKSHSLPDPEKAAAFDKPSKQNTQEVTEYKYLHNLSTDNRLNCCDGFPQLYKAIKRGGNVFVSCGGLDTNFRHFRSRKRRFKEITDYGEKLLEMSSDTRNGCGIKHLQMRHKWKFNTHKCVDSSPLIIQHKHGSSYFVFTASHSGQVSKLDLLTGKRVWSVILPGRFEASPCCSQDGHFLILGCYNGYIYTLCTATGKVVWQFSTGAEVKCSPMLNPFSGHILCGSHDGFIYCLDVQTRQCVWMYNLDGGSVFSSQCVSSTGDVVYVATLGGYVIALLADNGELMWRKGLKRPIFSSLCMLEDKILVGCVDSNLYCLDHTGSIVWMYQAAGPIFSSPTLHSNKILFGCHDHFVYCLTTDGEMMWKCKTDATVYATVFPFKMSLEQVKQELQVQRSKPFGSNYMDMESVCHASDNSGIRSKSSKANSQGIVKAGSASIGDGSIFTQNKKIDLEGQKNNDKSSDISKEKDGLQKTELASTSNFVRHEYLVAASSSGTLSVLDSLSGTVVSHYQLPGEVYSSPIVVDNHIVVGCRDNFTYCLELI